IVHQAESVDDFTVVVTYEDKELPAGVTWVDWALFEPVAESDGIVYRLAAAPNEVTPDFALAERAAEGFVKWDGCNEITIKGHHTCDLDARRAFLAFVDAAVHEAAKKLTSPEFEVSS